MTYKLYSVYFFIVYLQLSYCDVLSSNINRYNGTLLPVIGIDKKIPKSHTIKRPKNTEDTNSVSMEFPTTKYKKLRRHDKTKNGAKINVAIKKNEVRSTKSSNRRGLKSETTTTNVYDTRFVPEKPVLIENPTISNEPLIFLEKSMDLHDPPLDTTNVDDAPVVPGKSILIAKSDKQFVSGKPKDLLKPPLGTTNVDNTRLVPRKPIDIDNSSLSEDKQIVPGKLMDLPNPTLGSNSVDYKRIVP